jgi:hypothetical protein
VAIGEVEVAGHLHMGEPEPLRSAWRLVTMAGSTRKPYAGTDGRVLHERSRGFKLEKWGEGTPITSYDYSLVDAETRSIVVDRHQGLEFIENYLVGD